MPARTTRPRRWPSLAVNVLLALAVVALLAATWMPALCDHFAATKPAQ